MRVEGKNNRVAMRDYYEKPTLNLAPEQLKELSVKPCGRCEARLVVAGASVCNHCRRTRANYDRLAHYAAAILFAWWALIQLHGKEAVIGFFRFLELGIISTALVLTGGVLWRVAREWWLLNGEELLTLISKAVKNRIK